MNNLLLNYFARKAIIIPIDSSFKTKTITKIYVIMANYLKISDHSPDKIGYIVYQDNKM